MIRRAPIVCLMLCSAGWLSAQQVQAPRLPPILNTGSKFGSSYDCDSIDASILARLAAAQTQCPLVIVGGANFYTDQIRGDSLVVAFDKDGAMVAVHDRPVEATSSFAGTIDHVGQQDDVVHWGLWRKGTVETIPAQPRHAVDESNAIPYIVGVSATAVAGSDRFTRHLRRLTALPAEGTAKYVLLGDVGVVSGKDMRGNVVPIGRIRSADATVNFKENSAQVDLSIEVRGTTESIHLTLEPRNKILGFDSGAAGKGSPCRQPTFEEFCPAAAAQFYGRDGEFVGLTFSYGHNAVLSEAASVAAYLNNVPAQGAVVLRKDQTAGTP